MGSYAFFSWQQYVVEICNYFFSPIYDLEIKHVHRGCRKILDYIDLNSTFYQIKNSQAADFIERLSKKLDMVICLSEKDLIEAVKNQKNFDCLNYAENLQITDRKYEEDHLVYATFILPASIKANEFEEAILSGNLFITTCRTIAEVNIINREANEAFGKKLVVGVKVAK